jgi:hypothetical protein
VVELVDYIMTGFSAWYVCGMLFPYHFVLIGGLLYYIGYTQGKYYE